MIYNPDTFILFVISNGNLACSKVFKILFLLFLPVITAWPQSVPEISIVTDSQYGQPVAYGLNQLKESLQVKQISFEQVHSLSESRGKTVIIAGIDSGKNVSPTPEALTIRKTRQGNRSILLANGSDNTGLMYALLDIANRISWADDPTNPLQYVREATSEPYIKERGIALYTMHRRYWESRFYDEAYWEAYFGMMAKNRFNMLEILFGYENGGFLAPCYPYFFDVEGYPNVKIQAVSPEEQKKNVEAMHRLIAIAHAHGINVRLGIWDHIYRGEVQAGGNPDFEYVPGKPLPWQVSGLDSTNLNVYTKVAFAKFLKTFPDVDAILFKTNNESGLKSSELHEFSVNFFETVKENKPDLLIDIHSKGITDTLIRSAVHLGIKFRIAPKFWMEQMGLPFSPTHVNREDQKNRRHGYADFLRYPQEYNMLWKLWNGGTNRVFLWGDPEYVRRFAGSSRLYNSEAYAVYEPLATKMESQWHDVEPFQLLPEKYQYYRYEFERYWYFFQTFGLLGYDPQTPEDVSDKEFEKRFGNAGPIVKPALNEASRILPRIVAACYPYNFFPTTSAWVEKQRLGDLMLYAKAEGSDIQQFASFDEEARVVLGELETAKIRPSTTALWLEQTANSVLQKALQAEKIAGNSGNKELISTVTDLRMLAYLAMYHARRVPAAVNYCLFLRTQDISALNEAIACEQSAIEAWQQLVDAAGDHYADNILIGKKELSGHWRDELRLLHRGLEKLKERQANFQPAGKIVKSPRYQLATDASNSRYFTLEEYPVSLVKTGQPITIRVKIQAVNGLKWVRLQYRAMNQYKDFEMIPMAPTAEKDVFEVNIPSEKIDSRYDLMYLFEMMDNSGKGFIFPDLSKETPYRIIKQ
ncbi:hypothetical protein FACS189426_10810 [Bacteroidia bacterium]|nr:hypothetical protein FACS189426_10810 [Bacteroidia bacterium]GHT85114.1 hypothetical protein FACS18947_3470 [Bacteroidia bacterium]